MLKAKRKAGNGTITVCDSIYFVIILFFCTNCQFGYKYEHKVESGTFTIINYILL